MTIPEGQVADLKDWSATAKFWGRAAGSEPAILREVAPQADAASRTYLVRFSLPSSAETAELGSTVTIDLRREINGSAASIPSSALIFRDGKASVWRLTDPGNRVEPVAVSVERLGSETSDVRGCSLAIASSLLESTVSMVAYSSASSREGEGPDPLHPRQ